MDLNGHRDELLVRGVTVIRGVVSVSAARRLARSFDRCLPTDAFTGIAQQPGGARSDSVLSKWLTGGVLGSMGRRLLDCPEVRLLQDVLIAKGALAAGSPASGQIPWHRDAWYTGYLDPEGVLSVRLALDEELVESGGLVVLPGSHRWPEVHREGGTASSLPRHARSLLPPQLRAVAEEPVELAPGDLSVHLGRTWHASGPNRSAAPRRTVVTHLFDARLKVRPERLPAGDHFLLDAHGRLEESRFPRV